jgi:hypothetical protein
MKVNDIILESIHFLNTGEYDKSEQLLRNYPYYDDSIIFNLGWHEMRHGNMKQCFKNFDRGRLIHIFGYKNLYGKKWEGESLKEKTLIFRSEGGIGDQILNFRFAKKFQEMGANVIVYCNPHLIELFSRHGFECVSDSIPLELHIPSVKYDYWVPSLSAPLILNMEYEDLDGSPFIFASKLIELNSKSDKLKIGIRWSGNFIPGEENRRVFPELMLSLSEIPNTIIYSLQRDMDLVDYMPSVVDMRNYMNTLDDTANIIAGLDLVITCCTSIAHLSAAMGTPTWILTPIKPYYTWAVPGDKTRWYDSVRLFRQTKYGDYTEPIKQIRNELIHLINK